MNPPHDIDCEKSIIGTMILRRESVPMILSNIKQQHFFNQKLGSLFGLFENLFIDSKPIEVPIIMSEVSKSPDLYPSLSEIMELTGTVPHVSGVKSYCDRITETYKLRELIVSGQGMVQDCYANNDVSEIADDFGKRFFEIMAGDSKDSSAICDIVDEVVEDMEYRSTHGCDDGLKTGFIDVDKIFRLVKTELVVLAARPAMGKTAFSINIALNVARNGGNCLVFSLEMGKKQLVNRIVSQVAKVSNTEIKNGMLNEFSVKKLHSASEQIKTLGIVIDDTPALSITQIRARSAMENAKNKLDLIVVDYLQLAKGTKSQNREQEIAEISMGLKSLAKELDIPVIALSQLNRGLESRVDKRPIMSDLRESGSIEQDADIITFIYRDEVYNKNSDNPKKGEAEIIVSKNRSGSTGKAVLGFRGEHTEFYNPARIDDPNVF